MHTHTQAAAARRLLVGSGCASCIVFVVATPPLLAPPLPPPFACIVRSPAHFALAYRSFPSHNVALRAKACGAPPQDSQPCPAYVYAHTTIQSLPPLPARSFDTSLSWSVPVLSTSSAVCSLDRTTADTPLHPRSPCLFTSIRTYALARNAGPVHSIPPSPFPRACVVWGAITVLPLLPPRFGSRVTRAPSTELVSRPRIARMRASWW